AGRLGPDLDRPDAAEDDPAPAATTATVPATANGTGTATANGTAPAVEERKLVTVLAADLRGRRGDEDGAGHADPERVRRETGTWTDVLCEVAGRWGAAV